MIPPPGLSLFCFTLHTRPGGSPSPCRPWLRAIIPPPCPEACFASNLPEKSYLWSGSSLALTSSMDSYLKTLVALLILLVSKFLGLRILSQNLALNVHCLLWNFVLGPPNLRAWIGTVLLSPRTLGRVPGR